MSVNNVYGSLRMTPTGAAILLCVSLVIFIVFVFVLGARLSNSIKDSSHNNGRINQYLAARPADRLGTINAVYQNTRKSLSGALILCVVGGAFGIQRIYLGKRKSAMTMFLFFWTGIPTVISLFDLANMPLIISEFNLKVIESLYNQLAAPKIEE